MTSPSPTPSAQTATPHKSGRVAALCVFALGIALLTVVFYLSYQLFSSPVPGLGLTAMPTATPPPATAIGTALTAFVRQLLLLLIMTVAGSVIAGKGIGLYLTCANEKP